MNDNSNNSGWTTLAAVIILAVLTALFLRSRDRSSPDTDTSLPPIAEACYYQETISADRSVKDIAMLRMNIQDSKVASGELNILPAEKDSKTGDITGVVVTNPDQSTTANLWWNASAEGSTVREQLLVQFDKTVARIGFGAMSEQGDGSYVYTQPDSVEYTLSLNSISCDDMDDTLLVDQYVRDNIATLSAKQPVLGGTWYVVSTDIDPITDTGTVVYEDGHVQESLEFVYTRTGDSVVVTTKKPE